MVRHILADGREVDSIEGMVVPTTGPTAVVYRIVADFYNKRPVEITHQKKEEKTETH